MKIKVYYYLVADGNEKGMPIDGPFNSIEDTKNYANKEYDINNLELYNEKSSIK